MAKPTAQRGVGFLLESFTLLCICVMAFSIRLFSVLKYESVIHEFDPYFNFRITKVMTDAMLSKGFKAGIHEFWNFFDDRTWYPLGRVVGGTVYPGLMFTAGGMFWIAHLLNLPIQIVDVCVFTAPIFSANTAWAMYLLAKEVRGSGAGLCAAALVATVPSYISRSVAGSFDNEGIALFALTFTFFLYVKTLNTGSLAWATANALAYFYMVMSWGGYTFIINLIPIHCLASILMGRYHSRLYVAYCPLVVVGTLLAAVVPVVGFNAVKTSEHTASFAVLLIMQIMVAIKYLQNLLQPYPKIYRTAVALVYTSLLGFGVLLAALMATVVMASPTAGWSGRSLTLLDPTYASRFIPIIASVSEHQPPAWPSYFGDLHFSALLLPAGMIACLIPLTDASLFVLLYAVTSVYFSGVMVRLMLVLAPAACAVGGIALSEALAVFTASVKQKALVEGEGSKEEREEVVEASSSKKAMKKTGTGTRAAALRFDRKERTVPVGAAVWGLAGLLLLATFYVVHCVWISAEAYSSPSIVLTSRSATGLHVFDDFREAYAWLRYSTDEDCKVASWWDYGYQTTAMANRTVLVDNNTWNNTHIATVGRAMASPEYKAWKIFRSLDVKYVFVIFGGLVGYPSDDINKFLWMVRIGGGEFPEIKEADYLGDSGGYRIDAGASKTMLDSVMYKFSYYRFAEINDYGQGGYDRVRNTPIGRKNFKLKYFEEAFTTQHWMVRIYKVKDKVNREVLKQSEAMIEGQGGPAATPKRAMSSGANWRKAARKTRSKGNTPKKMFRRSSTLVSA